MSYTTISHTLERLLPAWLKREMALVPIRRVWRTFPLELKAGAYPMNLKGKTLVVGVDGAPRKVELNFQKGRILKLFERAGIVLEDVHFKPVPPDRLPSMSQESGDTSLPWEDR